jgi:hypothetical protein
MDPKRRGYVAYMLRLWRVHDGQKTIWHASLQDVRGGPRLGFADLDQVVAYLRQELNLPSEPRPSDREPDSLP